ncbi:ABC transporter ATP-binding protein [Paenibacillus sp. MWE-103]|uniref:ABC transporter ATP-binding protein n=1 Tax=Paenibacillus artemisiicola TaxID=1172618 RepID=A0ABS3W7Z7_9BACL|nr:ABC transporter ATP-binding protein [Paenibacillus artemisiicola]MBO7744403.1 ABC transporter ATP-binding protein [Paenibacillus artemisiicola]
MIRMTNVTKKYADQIALRDISLTVPIGKIIGIVGGNGSGKSTLLKLMSGLSRATSGSVMINEEAAGRRTGKFVSYASESRYFYPMFTVREAMRFQASQLPEFNLAKAEEIMNLMRLDPQMKIKSLSKGNRGRLQIVLTLAKEVPYILMDEPLSGLDPMIRGSIVKGMISYVDLNTQTLVMTSHEVAEIETLIDGFIALKDGSLLKTADMEELHESEALHIEDWMKKAY